jgi:hypothetical protein
MRSDLLREQRLRHNQTLRAWGYTENWGTRIAFYEAMIMSSVFHGVRRVHMRTQA